jgi:hypothetical protein
MKRSLLMLIIAAAVTVPAHAQEPNCQKDEALKACLERFGTQWTEPEIAKTNTGVENLTSPGQSASKDFLNMLAASLLMPMNGNGVGPLALAFNVPFGPSAGHRLKLEAVLARPALSDDVKQRLSANAAAMTATEDSLSEFDDVTVSGTLDPSTLRFGRSFAPHRESYATLLAARIGPVTPTAMDDATKQKIRTFAERFAVLLNHQPQLYGSVLYRARRSVAGPNERSARLTFEIARRSLNAFYHSNKTCRSVIMAECAEKLETFAGTTIEQDPADRLMISAEYRTSEGRTVALPDTVSFTSSGAHSLVYSLAYGRDHMMKRNGRIDLAVNYESTTVSKTTDLIPTAALIDPSKAVHDRFVASATYTYKITDNMALPLTLTYASHAADLGDVDHRLNAHIGVTFKMR